MNGLTRKQPKGGGGRESRRRPAERRDAKIHYENAGCLGYKGTRKDRTAALGSDFATEAKHMDATKIVKQGVRENPEVRIVMEIAARARAVEESSPAVDLTPKNDVVAVPTNLQFVVP